jgi:hypothetical protein
MTFPGTGRGRGSDSGNNHVVMSAGRGAILVAVAVVTGLLVLATVRDSKPSGSSTESTATTLPVVTTIGVPATNLDGTPAATSAATATTKPKKTTSTTTKSNARPNDQVVVQVLNGSGLQGAATTKTNDLKAKGYQTAAAGNAALQNGTTVQCKAGYDKEAQELVNQLATLGTTATVQPIPNPLPAGYEPTANCYVLLGK